MVVLPVLYLTMLFGAAGGCRPVAEMVRVVVLDPLSVGVIEMFDPAAKFRFARCVSGFATGLKRLIVECRRTTQL